MQEELKKANEFLAEAKKELVKGLHESDPTALDLFKMKLDEYEALIQEYLKKLGE